jgi:hypothetical protein
VVPKGPLLIRPFGAVGRLARSLWARSQLQRVRNSAKTEPCIGHCRMRSGQLHKWPALFCASWPVRATTRPVVRQGFRPVASDSVERLSEPRIRHRPGNATEAVLPRFLPSARPARTGLSTGWIARSPRPRKVTSPHVIRWGPPAERTHARGSRALPRTVPNTARAPGSCRVANSWSSSRVLGGVCSTSSRTRAVSPAWCRRARRLGRRAVRRRAARHDGSIAVLGRAPSACVPASLGFVPNRANSMTSCIGSTPSGYVTTSDSRRSRCRSAPSNGGSACVPCRVRAPRQRRCRDDARAKL